MSQHAWGAKATAAQRTEVERLRGEGVSIRRIAAQVFGDARYRGRVERILHKPTVSATDSVPLATDPLLEGVDFSELGWTALIRLLYERRLVCWAESGKAPSMTELRNMLEVQRRLAAFEEVERLRQLHHETWSG